MTNNCKQLFFSPTRRNHKIIAFATPKGFECEKFIEVLENNIPARLIRQELLDELTKLLRMRPEMLAQQVMILAHQMSRMAEGKGGMQVASGAGAGASSSAVLDPSSAGPPTTATTAIASIVMVVSID